MSVIKLKYSPEEVDNIYRYLQNSYDQSDPEEYEIVVDNFKVVKRTNDLSRFHSHENFIKENTKLLSILIYEGVSNRNAKYLFYFGEISEENENENEPILLKSKKNQKLMAGLNGFGEMDIDKRIAEKMTNERRNWELQQVKNENENLRNRLKDLEQELDESEDEVEELKARIEGRKNKFGEIHLGELAGVAFETFIRNNPQLLKAIPGGEALAGIIIKDNEQKALPNAQNEIESNVQFTAKTDPSDIKYEAQNQDAYIDVIELLRSHFTQAEITEIFNIIENLALEKSKIKVIIDLIKEQN